MNQLLLVHCQRGRVLLQTILLSQLLAVRGRCCHSRLIRRRHLVLHVHHLVLHEKAVLEGLGLRVARTTLEFHHPLALQVFLLKMLLLSLRHEEDRLVPIRSSKVAEMHVVLRGSRRLVLRLQVLLLHGAALKHNEEA